METFITVIHVLVALFMILVVLVQGGNAGGVGAAFGGGNSSGLFGASGANKFLSRLTYGAAGVFVITSIMLTVIQGRNAKTGLLEKLQNAAPAPTAPADPAATPAPATEAPAAVPAAESEKK